MQVISGLIPKIASHISDILAEKTHCNNKCKIIYSANYACCISKAQIFLFYGHSWVLHCLDKGGLTVNLLKNANIYLMKGRYQEEMSANQIREL